MSKYVTAKENTAILDLAAEITRAAADDITNDENLRRALAARLPDVDAAQIVADINNGIRSFDESLSAAQTGDLNAVITEKLSNAISGKNLDAQYQILASMLNGMTGDEEPKIDIDEGLDADETIVKELLSALTERIADYSLAFTDGEAAALLIREIGEDAANALREVTLRDQSRHYIALAAYILKCEGKLPSMPNEMTAEAIAVSIAASISMDDIIRDGAAGKLVWEKVLVALKAIAAVAVTLLAVVVAVNLSLAVASIAFIFGQIIFGFGIVGTIVAGALALMGFGKALDAVAALSEKAMNGINITIDKLAEWYLKIKGWCIDVAIPAISAFWINVKEKAAGIWARAAEHFDDEDEEEDEEDANDEHDEVYA